MEKEMTNEELEALKRDLMNVPDEDDEELIKQKGANNDLEEAEELEALKKYDQEIKTAEEFLDNQLQHAFQTHDEDGITRVHLEHSYFCEILDKYANHRTTQLRETLKVFFGNGFFAGCAMKKESSPEELKETADRLFESLLKELE